MQRFMARTATRDQGDLAGGAFCARHERRLERDLQDLRVRAGKAAQAFTQHVVDVVVELFHYAVPSKPAAGSTVVPFVPFAERAARRSHTAAIATCEVFEPGSIWPIARSPRKYARPFEAT